VHVLNIFLSFSANKWDRGHYVYWLSVSVHRCVCVSRFAVDFWYYDLYSAVLQWRRNILKRWRFYSDRTESRHPQSSISLLLPLYLAELCLLTLHMVSRLIDNSSSIVATQITRLRLNGRRLFQHHTAPGLSAICFRNILSLCLINTDSGALKSINHAF